MDPLNSSANISFLSLPYEVQGLIFDELSFKDIFVTWRKVCKSFRAILEANLSKNESLHRKSIGYLPLYSLIKNNVRGSFLGRFNELGIPEKIPDHSIGKAFQFKLEENKQGLWELVEITTAVDIIGLKVLKLTINEFNRDYSERVKLAKPSDALLQLLYNNKFYRLFGRFNEAGIPEDLVSLPSEERSKILQFILEKDDQGLWKTLIITSRTKFTLEQQEVLKLTLDKFNKDAREQADLAQPSDFLYDLLISRYASQAIVGRFDESGMIEDMSSIFERTHSTDDVNSMQFKLEKDNQGMWKITQINPHIMLTCEQRRMIELTLEKFRTMKPF